MGKKIIICDEIWYGKKSVLDEIDYDEIIRVSYKRDFSYKILNEIYKRTDDTICIVGKNYGNMSDIDKVLKFTHNNNKYVVVNLNKDSEFDFSGLTSNNTIISFPASIFDNNPDTKKFSTILNLQKHLLTIAINSNKYYLYILNNKNRFKKVETDEDKLIKTIRYKPSIRNKTHKTFDDKPVKQINQKPKVLIICDVQGWAWWLKSQYIKKYLSPYYDIDVISVIDDKKPIDYKKYDIYFTYGYSYVSKIRRADFNRRVAGVTAHRPIEIIEPKLDNVKWVHANSILLYNEISDRFKNTFYVPNGVDEQLFYPQKEILQGKNMIFGHVGKLSPKKGQKEFLEPAVNKAKVKYYSHYNNYKNKVKHEGMPKIHHKYDVFLCASEEDGTPCPALEAAACGRPIISNRIGNMPELVENYKTGILLDSRNVDDYVDAIKWCKENPDKVQEMGKNIRRKIETEWTWKLMSRNYLNMFDKMLGINRDLSYYENPALYHGIK